MFEDSVELGFEFVDFSVARAGQILLIMQEIMNTGLWMVSSHHTEASLILDGFYFLEVSVVKCLPSKSISSGIPSSTFSSRKRFSAALRALS